MRYQWICGNYNFEDKSISGYVRREDGQKLKRKITGFMPYYLVNANEFIPKDDKRIVKVEDGFKGLAFSLRETIDLKKIYVTDPLSVRKMRKNHHETWEADVRFVRRMLIDTQIKAGFSAPDKYEINYTELQPSNYTRDPVYSIFDIEVNNEERIPDPNKPTFEIICATVWDSDHKRYLTVLYWPEEYDPKRDEVWLSDNWLLKIVDKERDLLTIIATYFKRLWPDIISGWYIDFDVEYFKARCDKLGIKYYLNGIIIFDLIRPYRTIRGGSYGNRLKDVAVEEGFVKASELVSSEFRSELWTDPNQHDDLIEYNRDDVRYCLLLVRKYNIIRFFWGLKNYSGTEDINTTSYTQLVDTLLLRISKIYLPTVAEIERPSFRGAAVLPTIIGVHSGVAILDFSTMYINEIIAKQYSPELMNYPLEERIKMRPGLAPKLCMILRDQRLQYDQFLALCQDKYGADHKKTKVAELLRNVSKFLLLSVWGYLAYRKCRIHDVETMELMVKDCREWLRYVKFCAEDEKYVVVAGDTDSIMVIVPFEDRHKLAEILQNDIKKRAKDIGLENYPHIKVDAFAKKAIFVRAKGKKRGVMKRYVMSLIEKNNRPCSMVEIKGFEAIRGDQSTITKNIQKDCFESIFNDKLDLFGEKVQKVVRGILNNELPLDDIAIRMNLRKKLLPAGKKITAKNKDKYYKTNAEYVRGAKFANEYLDMNIQQLDRVKMLFVKNVHGYPATDVVCYLDVDKLPKMTINTEKIIDRTIKKKIETVLEVTDWNWDRIMGKKTLAEAFG